jgi:hypothetical protein
MLRKEGLKVCRYVTRDVAARTAKQMGNLIAMTSIGMVYRATTSWGFGRGKGSVRPFLEEFPL